MATEPDFTDSRHDDLLLRLLRESIRSELKVELMKVAEEQVDAAADRAIAGLETHIKRVFSEQYAGNLINVVVERHRLNPTVR
jgi:hypothetical protein